MNKKILKTFFGFSFYRSHLNPEKHMYLHNVQHEYEDKMYRGRFFLPKKLAEMDGGYYKKDVIKHVFDFFNKDKEILKIEEYNEIYLDSWQLYDIDIEKDKIDLIAYLSEKIINTKSNKRYLVEKKERFEFMRDLFEKQELKTLRINDFMELYSYYIDLKNDLDLGRTKEIIGKPTSYEEDFFEDESDNKDLAKEFDDEQNSNFINKFMKFLHC